MNQISTGDKCQAFVFQSFAIFTGSKYHSLFRFPSSLFWSAGVLSQWFESAASPQGQQPPPWRRTTFGIYIVDSQTAICLTLRRPRWVLAADLWLRVLLGELAGKETIEEEGKECSCKITQSLVLLCFIFFRNSYDWHFLEPPIVCIDTQGVGSVLQDYPSQTVSNQRTNRELRKGGPHPPQQPHPSLPINSPAMSLLLDLRGASQSTEQHTMRYSLVRFGVSLLPTTTGFGVLAFFGQHIPDEYTVVTSNFI